MGNRLKGKNKKTNRNLQRATKEKSLDKVNKSSRRRSKHAMQRKTNRA